MVKAIDAMTKSEASIAVITPYRAQKLLITKKLGKPQGNWTVMTVDASQGTVTWCMCSFCVVCVHVIVQAETRPA